MRRQRPQRLTDIFCASCKKHRSTHRYGENGRQLFCADGGLFKKASEVRDEKAAVRHNQLVAQIRAAYDEEK